MHSFFPPLYTKLIYRYIIRGPVYKRILLFLLSHRRRWSEKKIYRERCAAGDGNIALPVEQLHNSSAPLHNRFSFLASTPKLQPQQRRTCQKYIDMHARIYYTLYSSCRLRGTARQIVGQMHEYKWENLKTEINKTNKTNTIKFNSSLFESAGN